MGAMFYSFTVSVIIGLLAFQADNPVLAVLGWILSGWMLLTGLIVTYRPKTPDDRT